MNTPTMVDNPERSVAAKSTKSAKSVRGVSQYMVYAVLTALVLLLALFVWRTQKSSEGNPNPNIAYLNAATPIDTSQYPSIVLGMGCFWGAEKRMLELNGVVDVEAGYAGGDDPNPRYDRPNDAIPRDGYKGKSHAEVVRVYYDPQKTSLEQVLAQFWQSHDPTQGNRQGNDVGENYRSAIYYATSNERDLALKTQAIYQKNLKDGGYNKTITTEIEPVRHYKKAEEYHQDYLLKNPQGYCGLGGVGIAYHDSNMTLISAQNTQNAQVDTTNSANAPLMSWDAVQLSDQAQLIAFEADYCAYCKKFNADIANQWQHPTPLV